MHWKYLKIGGLILLSLLVIIPSFLYFNGFDWAKKHSTRVSALPLLDTTVDKGAYRLKANHLEFLIRVAGMKNDGPAVILLHGFPESSLMWQPLLDKAASEGYRVVAFDQRGYSPMARPKGIEHYQLDSLVQDVLAVANQVGFDTFHLVGHDWGAGVGWKTVMDYPERIRTWTAMSIPHIGVFLDAIENHPEQQKRSAYMGQLRRPFVPEFLFSLNQKRVADGLARSWSPELIHECFAIQREYGALTAALNWYRAADPKYHTLEQQQALKKSIIRPTLFIWGKEDPVVASEIIPLQKPYIQAPYQEISLETGHSLIQLEPEKVIDKILLHWRS